MISMTNTFHRLRWPNHLTAHPRPDALRLGQLDAAMAANATVPAGPAPEPEDRPAAAKEPVTAERFLTVPEVAASSAFRRRPSTVACAPGCCARRR